MDANAKLDMMTFLSKEISEHSLIVAVKRGKKTALLLCETSVDEPSVVMKPSDVDPASMKEVVERIGRDDIQYLEIEPLMVEKPGIEDRKFDIAPILHTFFHNGGDVTVGEICAASYGGTTGCGGVCINPVVECETGIEYDGDEPVEDEMESADLTEDELMAWAKKLSKSQAESVRELGAFVKEKLVYFKDHDLEGNVYDKDGNIIGHEDDEDECENAPAL